MPQPIYHWAQSVQNKYQKRLWKSSTVLEIECGALEEVRSEARLTFKAYSSGVSP